MDITYYFDLPISTIKDKMNIDTNIISDLELIDNKDNEKTLSTFIFNPKNTFSEQTQKLWFKYYTNNTKFLKESQNLYKAFKITGTYNDTYLNSIYNKYTSYKTDTGFKEKYGFIDWSHLEFLNHYEYFLLGFSLLHILSPLFSLILPIIFLLLPYVILLIQGIPIDITTYANILSRMFRGHVLSKIFTGEIFDQDIKQTAYFIITIIMYIFQVYSNILSCIRFHHNISCLHDFLQEMNDYISYTVKNMELYINYIRDLNTYKKYQIIIETHINTLKKYLNKINKIQPYSWSLSELLSLGYIQKNFYSIHNDENLNNSIMFSFGFHGYIDNIIGIQQNIKRKKINYCTFNKNKNTKFTKAFFCNNTSPVKNSYELKDKYIITGPNASGKTTLLKATLLNILLSQQIGCGFYKNANVNPYKYIHCYLNIPDTTGRDSLFQAEARRCKEIIEITQTEKERHFCIFDELYSGTNPYEAEASSYSFIKYLSTFKNVDFMMTTHLIKLCESLDNLKTNIKNFNMKTQSINKYDFKYTYILEKGISKIKGAVKVLKELNYPDNIIDTTLEYLK